jgi:putative ABC transport system permease protein
MAWESMKQRRFRTSLTTLGVVIGITAIIGLASLGEGFRVTIKTEMEQGFELNVLTIMSGGLLTGVGNFFTDEDVKNISQMSGVVLATPIIQKSVGKLYNDRENSTALVLLAVNYTEFVQIYPDRLAVEHGEWPQSIFNDTSVIGYNVEHRADSETFANTGENVTVALSFTSLRGRYFENHTFNVVGTLGKSGAAGFINFDDAVFIPIDTARTLYNTTNSDMIFVRLADPNYSDSVAKAIQDRFGGGGEVRVLVPAAFMEQVETILSMVQIFLTAIASIALLVAGLGIMNIMTVSVMERTREIGILKAIGAKSRTVLTMFLAEAALIGLLGGVIGVPLGYGLAQIMGQFLFRFSAEATPRRSLITGTETQPLTVVTPILSLQWVVGAIVFAVGVSVIFGWYPARKAAKLDPVEALRYD